MSYPPPSFALDAPLTKRAVAYYRRRVCREVYDVVDELFHKSGLTKQQLAQRLGKDPAWVSRTLGAPGNWTLETIVELCLGIGVDPRALFAREPK